MVPIRRPIFFTEEEYEMNLSITYLSTCVLSIYLSIRLLSINLLYKFLKNTFEVA